MFDRHSKKPLILTLVAFSAALVLRPAGAQTYAPPCMGTPCPVPDAETIGARCAANVNEERRADASDPVAAVLYRHILSDPLAKCNDGTPAVFYFREAMSSTGNPAPDSDKWVIVFEGGGTAFDNSENGTLDSGMMTRWGHLDPTENLDCAHKLSTDFLDRSNNLRRDGTIDMPEEVVVGGILHPGSSFATWNWVYLNSCTSDHYLGTTALDLFDMQTTDKNGTERESDDTIYTGHRIHFQGRNVVNAVMDILQQQVPPSGTPIEYFLPDIDTASVVVLAGDSAGGGGVQNNLDYIHYRLNGKGTNPLSFTRVLGAIGASHSPSIGIEGVDSWYIDNDGNEQDDFVDGAKKQIEQVRQINGAPDASCMLALAPDDQWQCLALASVEPYLGRPHLIRQDMTDFQSVNDTLGGRGRYTSAQFRDGITSDYADWASSARDVAIFAPDCGDHEVLGNSSFFTTAISMTESDIFGTALKVAVITYDSALHDLTQGIVTQAWDGRHSAPRAASGAITLQYDWATLRCR